jgi:hypothetical protein
MNKIYIHQQTLQQTHIQVVPCATNPMQDYYIIRDQTTFEEQVMPST